MMPPCMMWNLAGITLRPTRMVVRLISQLPQPWHPGKLLVPQLDMVDGLPELLGLRLVRLRLAMVHLAQVVLGGRCLDGPLQLRQRLIGALELEQRRPQPVAAAVVLFVVLPAGGERAPFYIMNGVEVTVSTE